jgi:dienelactone hydrolase
MRKRRYLSPFESVTAWIENERSALSFGAGPPADYRAWREQFEGRLRGLLGPTPDPVPLEPEVLEAVDCGSYVREKVVFDTERYCSVVAYVLVPATATAGSPRPAVLAAHGHGRGKADICGVCADQEQADAVRALNYDYAVQFAEAGYVVIAPDWRGFGERLSPPEWARQGRDPCNVNYMAHGYLGHHLLTLQIWDGMRCVDYLQQRPDVQPDRIGVAGLSFGGTMTTYLAALDQRLRVACISGYLSTVKHDAMTMRGLANFCGSQYMPGLLTIGDIPDVAGLIAPRPLVVEMGEADQCFVIDDMVRAFDHLRAIYDAAGAGDRLVSDRHPGGHQWSGAVAFPWFERWLA